MGHDTCGYKGRLSETEDDKEEIAYLRRSMSCPDNRRIYELLGAENAYAGVSGDGNDIYFTQDQLIEALRRCPDDDEHEDQRKFLIKLVDAGEDGATVGFY